MREGGVFLGSVGWVEGAAYPAVVICDLWSESLDAASDGVLFEDVDPFVDFLCGEAVGGGEVENFPILVDDPVPRGDM